MVCDRVVGWQMVDGRLADGRVVGWQVVGGRVVGW